MIYEISPYVGVGALRFGMTPAQTGQILAAPRFSRRDAHRLREMHGVAGPALTFKAMPDGEKLELVEIGFGKAAPSILYRGTDLFARDPAAVISKLYSDDPDPKDVSGTLVFQRLGVSLTGFHSGPKEGMAATAFASGTWDALFGTGKPFKLA